MKKLIGMIFLFGVILGFSAPAAAEEIKLRSIGGVYTVPVRLNDQLTTDFMIDTGAADVGLSEQFAKKLLGTGVIAERDFKGSMQYTMADGSLVTCRGLTLRSVRIGGREVADVKASACPGEALLLLGQSFLKKLGPWALDYQREYLMVMSEAKKAFEPPTYQPKDVEWQENAGAQGDAAAQFNLALMFEKGDGVPRDPKKAVEFLQQSASQGYAPAETALASLYETGDRLPKNPSKALELYRRAAEKGYPRAMLGLSNYYRDGKGVQKDIARGIELLEKAAERGEDVAAVNLGLMYQYGQDAPKDAAKAAEWYRKGADRGGLLSQYYLGQLSLSGEGVDRDVSKGIALIQKSAEQGLTMAQHRLGVLYATADKASFPNNEVSEDRVLGYAWCQVAYAKLLGVPDDVKPAVARELGEIGEDLASLEKGMTPAQIAEAKRLAATWKPGQGLKRKGK